MQQYYGAPGSLTAPPHSWSNGISTVFRVRGKDYLQDKIKVVPGESPSSATERDAMPVFFCHPSPFARKLPHV